MPNRIVRDGILFSVPISRLTPQAELFYRKLLSVVDDFGRFYAAPPQILISSCYPLQVGKVSVKDIGKWLNELVKCGLVEIHLSGTKKVLEILKFDQRRRAKVSKFPVNTGSSPIDCHTGDGQVAVTCPSGGSHMSPEYEVEVEVEVEVENDRRRNCVLPKEWALNDEHRGVALDEGVDVERAEAIFRNWALGGGHKKKNWDRAFTNALLNEEWMKKQAPAKRNTNATGEELKPIKIK